MNAQMLRFASVGLVTTTLDFVLFALFTEQFGLLPTVGNLASYTCGMITSFVLNRWWTFARERKNARVDQHAWRFLATNITGLLISTGLVALFVLFLPGVVAKIATVPIVFFWNYLISKFWVFR
ncbi:MAG: GtrA family protein [Stappiaceae bacterium]